MSGTATGAAPDDACTDAKTAHSANSRGKARTPLTGERIVAPISVDGIARTGDALGGKTVAELPPAPDHSFMLRRLTEEGVLAARPAGPAFRLPVRIGERDGYDLQHPRPVRL